MRWDEICGDAVSPLTRTVRARLRTDSICFPGLGIFSIDIRTVWTILITYKRQMPHPAGCFCLILASGNPRIVINPCPVVPANHRRTRSPSVRSSSEASEEELSSRTSPFVFGYVETGVSLVCI